MKIAVVGCQNTGKTTLISRLVKDCPGLRTPAVTYRDIIAREQLPLNEQASTSSQQRIAEFYLDQIEQYRNEPHLIWDRFLIDVLVYSSLISRPDPGFLDQLFNTTRSACAELDLIILTLTTPVVPLTKDGLRSIDPHYIDRVNSRFVETMLQLNLPVNKIFVYSQNRYQELVDVVRRHASR